MTPAIERGGKGRLVSSGSLDSFEKVQLTSAIGTEFSEEVQLQELLRSDNLIRDLAIFGHFHLQ